MDIHVDRHYKLNPKLWDDDQMRSEVRKHLKAIANAFIDYCGRPLKVKDIWLVGSQANKRWNSDSDIDLQVIANLPPSNTTEGKLIRAFYDTRKKVFKRDHPITVNGLPVEVTVSDDNVPAGNEGCYSIQDGKWLVLPDDSKPDVNRAEVHRIASKWRRKILDLVHDDEARPSAFDHLQSRIKKARSRALVRSDGDNDHPVNVAYKHLRARGLLDRLKDEMRQRLTKQLSLRG